MEVLSVEPPLQATSNVLRPGGEKIVTFSAQRRYSKIGERQAAYTLASAAFAAIMNSIV